MNELLLFIGNIKWRHPCSFDVGLWRTYFVIFLDFLNILDMFLHHSMFNLLAF